jgi:4-amino-4-deoxy-L-arabinose transferase-like glycosyltransferase
MGGPSQLANSSFQSRQVQKPTHFSRGVEIAGVKLQLATLILPAIAALILSICFWQNMQGSDDLGYARIAISLLPGHQTPVSFHQLHHEARLGVTYPLATIFLLAGISRLSLALLPLLCMVFKASLVAWLACYFWGEPAGLSAGLLYALLPLSITLSSFYVPEPMLIFELCLASVLFLSAIERQDRNA